MERALRFIASSLPVVFAFAFLVPVIDLGMQALGMAAPLGLSTLAFALVIGGSWGIFAQIKGRWV